MPLYEYECKKCGTVFELLQKLSEPPLKIHDHCGGQLEKLVSPSAFQFKGSGFYITDYAGKKSKERAKDSAPAKEVKGGDGKPAGDAKPTADSSPSTASTKTS
jgi:putative FmdB family regulatory protein